MPPKLKQCVAHSLTSDILNTMHNTRIYTGQKLGIQLHTGEIRQIEDKHLDLVLIDKISNNIPTRILDKSPITGTKILEM